jgi:hypothetical protein
MIDKDKGYNNLLKFFKQAGKKAEVGIFENKQDDEGGSIAQYAGAIEYGIGQPERSFMRSTFDENSTEINRDIMKHIEKGMLTNEKFEVLLKVHGENLRNKIITKIKRAKEWVKDPLSPITIARKGHDTLLIESGNMWKSIDVRIT